MWISLKISALSRVWARHTPRIGPLWAAGAPFPPPLCSGSGVCAGGVREANGPNAGDRASGHGSSVWRPSADRISLGWQLPHGGMRGQPPGAFRRRQGCRNGVRGARQVSDEGVEAWQWLRVSFTQFIVQPDARILALESVATADMGAAGRRRATPPPYGRARAASCGGNVGAGVHAEDPARRPVEDSARHRGQ